MVVMEEGMLSVDDQVRRHRQQRRRWWRRQRGGDIGCCVSAVLTVSVASKIDLALESSATLLTSKWFETRVLAAVRNKIRRLAKRFAANDTLVRLFAL